MGKFEIIGAKFPVGIYKSQVLSLTPDSF